MSACDNLHAGCSLQTLISTLFFRTPILRTISLVDTLQQTLERVGECDPTPSIVFEESTRTAMDDEGANECNLPPRESTVLITFLAITLVGRGDLAPPHALDHFPELCRHHDKIDRDSAVAAAEVEP